jgi:hypothetical protein
MELMENSKALSNGFVYLSAIAPTILQDVK